MGLPLIVHSIKFELWNFAYEMCSKEWRRFVPEMCESGVVRRNLLPPYLGHIYTGDICTYLRKYIVSKSRKQNLDSFLSRKHFISYKENLFPKYEWFRNIHVFLMYRRWRLPNIYFIINFVNQLLVVSAKRKLILVTVKRRNIDGITQKYMVRNFELEPF